MRESMTTPTTQPTALSVEEIRRRLLAKVAEVNAGETKILTIDEVLDALSPRPASAGDGWREIESAPPLTSKELNDWFHAIVFCPHEGESGAVGEATRKSEGDWWWANEDSEYGDEIQPTHWMPLPAPPSPEPEGGA